MLHQILVHASEEFFSSAINSAYQFNDTDHLYTQINHLLIILKSRMQEDKELRETARKTVNLLIYSAMHYLNGPATINHGGMSSGTKKDEIAKQLEKLRREQLERQVSRAPLDTNTDETSREEEYGNGSNWWS